MKKDKKRLKKASDVFKQREYKSCRDGYFGVFGGRYVPDILINA